MAEKTRTEWSLRSLQHKSFYDSILLLFYYSMDFIFKTASVSVAWYNEICNVMLSQKLKPKNTTGINDASVQQKYTRYSNVSLLWVCSFVVSGSSLINCPLLHWMYSFFYTLAQFSFTETVGWESLSRSKTNVCHSPQLLVVRLGYSLELARIWPRGLFKAGIPMLTPGQWSCFQ